MYSSGYLGANTRSILPPVATSLVEAPPPMAAGTVLLNGHFHVPACVDHGAFLYVNPGSTSIPKAGSAPGYLVLEDRTFTWKDMEGSAYKTHTVA